MDRLREKFYARHAGIVEFFAQWEADHPACGATREELEGAAVSAMSAAQIRCRDAHQAEMGGRCVPMILLGAEKPETVGRAAFWSALGQEPPQPGPLGNATREQVEQAARMVYQRGWHDGTTKGMDRQEFRGVVAFRKALGQEPQENARDKRIVELEANLENHRNRGERRREQAQAKDKRIAELEREVARLMALTQYPLLVQQRDEALEDVAERDRIIVRLERVIDGDRRRIVQFMEQRDEALALGEKFLADAQKAEAEVERLKAQDREDVEAMIGVAVETLYPGSLVHMPYSERDRATAAALAKFRELMAARPPEPEEKCGHTCHEYLVRDWKFCPWCGVKLEAKP